MRKKETFREFEATELYCPNCRRSVPVRKKLLLVLANGDKYDYSCVYCGTSVGDKTVTRGSDFKLVLK